MKLFPMVLLQCSGSHLGPRPVVAVGFRRNGRRLLNPKVGNRSDRLRATGTDSHKRDAPNDAAPLRSDHHTDHPSPRWKAKQCASDSIANPRRYLADRFSRLGCSYCGSTSTMWDRTVTPPRSSRSTVQIRTAPDCCGASHFVRISVSSTAVVVAKSGSVLAMRARYSRPLHRQLKLLLYGVKQHKALACSLGQSQV